MSDNTGKSQRLQEEYEANRRGSDDIGARTKTCFSYNNDVEHGTSWHPAISSVPKMCWGVIAAAGYGWNSKSCHSKILPLSHHRPGLKVKYRADSEPIWPKEIELDDD